MCFDQIEVDHSLGSSSDLSKQYINCYTTLSVAENIRRNQGSTRYRWRSYRRSCVVWMFSWNVSIRVLISDCLTDISHLWPNKMCECTLSLYLVNIKDNKYRIYVNWKLPQSKVSSFEAIAKKFFRVYAVGSWCCYSSSGKQCIVILCRNSTILYPIRSLHRKLKLFVLIGSLTGNPCRHQHANQ